MNVLLVADIYLYRLERERDEGGGPGRPWIPGNNIHPISYHLLDCFFPRIYAFFFRINNKLNKVTYICMTGPAL